MKQSERMRKYREYHEHPLREEYEKKCKGLVGERTPLGKVLKICSIICIVIFIVCGILFFIDVSEIMYVDTVCVFFVGIINIPIGIIFFCASDSNSKFVRQEHPDFKKIEKEYADKGLIKVDDPFRERCGEYNRYDVFVCSATQEPLSRQEEIWCQYSGNCSKCAKFYRAMGLDPNRDWLRDKIEKW